MARMVLAFVVVMVLNSSKAAAQLHLRLPVDSISKKISVGPLPQNFYNQHLGYFCKKEIQLQKITSLPVFIRLGSKEYVDYLERKPNAIKKNYSFPQRLQRIGGLWLQQPYAPKLCGLHETLSGKSSER